MDVNKPRPRLYSTNQLEMIRKYSDIKKFFPEGHNLRVSLSKRSDKPKRYIRWCNEHLGFEMDRWAYYKKAIIFKNIEDKVFFTLSCIN